MTSAPPAPEIETSFRVRVLGPFALERAGVLVDTGRWQRRVMTLLKLLAIAPDRRRRRDEIIDLLWPEATPETGAGNLRLVVHRLRLALGETEPQSGGEPHSPSPVISEQGWIGLNPAYSWESDIEEFERLVRAAGRDPAALERAAALYHGEPLAEDAYEDWAAPVRDRIARQWRDICLRLSGLHRARGSTEDALQWLERLLQVDPLDEEAFREVLGLLSELGRGKEALRRFRQFERLLAQELDVPPDPETLAMVVALESGLRESVPELVPRIVERARELAPVAPSYPLPTVVPLLGRAESLEEIVALFPPGATGSARLAFVAAEAGVGKTRLLAEVADRARQAGILTLAGGCYEQEGHLPYGPIHDALLDYVRTQPEIVLRVQLDGLLPELARIVPELPAHVGDIGSSAAMETESLRLRLFATVTQVLERISQDRPLVLLLDDLHWADEATVQLLHFLLRQRRLEGALIVGAYRREEVGEDTPLAGLMAALVGDEPLPVTFVSLASLRKTDIRRLLEERLGGACAENLASALYDHSAGNPFFVLQTLRLLEQEGRLVQTPTGWDLVPGGPDALPLPPRVQETIARRLRHLNGDEREALAIAAVVGREFAYSALEPMWDKGEHVLFRALDAARDAYLLRETESGYAFRHPILREVVYRQLSAGRRRRLHERAGRALEAVYGLPNGHAGREHAAELAWHFLQARDRQRALRYALVAGDQAESAFAHAEAERSYRTALGIARELADASVERKSLEKLGQVLGTVGRYDEAQEVLERAAESHRAAQDLEAELRAVAAIARVHTWRGTFDKGVAQIRGVLHGLGEDVSSHGLCALYLALAHLLFRTGRYGEQLEAAERAAEIARAVEDKALLAEAELQRAYSLPWTGRQEDFAPALEGVIRLAEEIGELTTLCRALCAVSYPYSERGDFEKSRLSLDRALEVAERIGDPARIAFATYLCGLDRFWRGEWDNAERLFKRSLATYQELGAVSDVMIPLYGLGALRMAAGDWEEGARMLEEHTAIAHETGDLRWIHAVQALLAERDLLEGRPDQGRARLERFLDLPGTSPTAIGAVLPTLAWACLQTGDTARGEEIAARATAQARAEHDQRNLVEALRVQGLVMSRQERWSEAEQCFGEALSLVERMPYPYARGRVLYDYGLMCRDQGELTKARELLTAALAVFRRLGARPHSERTERALLSTPAPGR